MKKLMLLPLLAIAACGPSVKVISVDPPAPQIKQKGGTITVRATPKDDKGQAVPDVQLTWSSSDATVATVDAAGKVTALKSGKAVITAKAGDIAGTSQLNVSIPSSLTLTPAEITLQGMGQTASVQSTVKDDTGAVIVNQPVAYSSSDPNVAAVDLRGGVRSIGPGTATITGKTEALTAQAKVTVSMPAFDKLDVKPKGALKLKVGKTEHLTAAATTADGKDVMGIPIKWASDHADVVTVTPTGDVSAVKKGKATLTATAGDKSEKVMVTVQ